MDSVISNTFSDSLDRLTGQEQKIAKTTAFDLQLNPAHPSLQFHRIDRSKDPDFWSVRVSRDIRIIVHKSGSRMVLCYVDHHDKAYAWADPSSGSGQALDLGHGFHEVETLPEKDRVRYTLSPAVRKEVLRRLLALNHLRAGEEKERAEAKGKGQKAKGKRGGQKKKGAAEEAQMGLL